MSKSDIVFIIALLLALWFALTSWIWVYYICLFIGYPAGIISFLLWFKRRKVDPKTNRYKTILTLLILGMANSLGFLFFLLIYN